MIFANSFLAEVDIKGGNNGQFESIAASDRIKIAKLIENPTIEKLSQELETLAPKLEEICDSPTRVFMDMKASRLDEILDFFAFLWSLMVAFFRWILRKFRYLQRNEEE